MINCLESGRKYSTREKKQKRNAKKIANTLVLFLTIGLLNTNDSLTSGEGESQILKKSTVKSIRKLKPHKEAVMRRLYQK